MAARRARVTGADGLAQAIQSGDTLDWGPSGAGYATGEGGAVSQLTSRTTGVTLSKPCGAITLFAAATTAGQVSTFTVTNTLVGVDDVVLCSLRTGAGIYFFTTKAAAGAFNLSVYTPAIVASEAPVINFAIVKGASA